MAGDIETLLGDARQAYDRNDLDRAEELFRAVFAADRTNGLALTYLGSILNETGRHREALPYLLVVPYHLMSGRPLAILRSRLAMTLLTLGYLKDAVEAFSLMFAADASMAAEQAARFIGDARDRLRLAASAGRPVGDGGAPPVEAVFREIYDLQVWGDGSGGGSDPSYSAVYAGYVQHLLRRYRPRTVLDIGCGDWRFSRYIDFAGSNYLGIDVVDTVVESNSREFGRDGIRFAKLDASEREIPQADLILCKDVLQHLDDGRADRIVKQASRSPLFLLTNDYTPVNLAGELGGTRALNPLAEPFSLEAIPVLHFAGKVAFLAQRAAEPGAT